VKSQITSIVQECRRKLIQTRAEILDRVRTARLNFEELDKGGDEADQTMGLLAENEFLGSQERLKQQLLEVELALARIEQGRYGICEETEEPIQPDRLLALPWTRVSLEGAEIREALKRRFAR
jgi:DnaK suppressor protein